MSGALALVDCNNFYASCERLFDPRLRGRPVVVLSNNDGCVIARSNVAKALGIEMTAPWHLIKQKFAKDGVVVRSSNYTLYGDMSRRVMRILSTFTPDLEIYSIDEAFLGLRGLEDIERRAHGVRDTILQWTGLPVSIGIAPTKTLAKTANRLAKKGDGVRVLMTPEAQVEALRQMQLTDLWGVAERMAKRLAAIGITSPLELRDADPHTLRQHTSVVMERMSRELQGITCIGLVEMPPTAKSIMCSRSFGRAVTERVELQQAVCSYAERAASTATC
jgi:DNA polymerase V